MQTYDDGLSGSLDRDGWSGSMAASTWSWPCEMFSSAGPGAAEAQLSPDTARSAATTASTDGWTRLIVRRMATGNPETGSAEESTSASRASSAVSSSPPPAPRVSPPLAEPWSASSSSFAAAESESSEWSAPPDCFDGEGSWERFRLRHLSFASGRELGFWGGRGGVSAGEGARFGELRGAEGLGRVPEEDEALRGIVAGAGGGGTGGGSLDCVPASEGGHGGTGRHVREE